MDSTKVLKLKTFLGQLPEQMARQLLTAVELDRVAGGDDLPHDMLLDGLRPHVVRSDDEVHRTPSPMRLFCDPFEDLLVVNHKGGKQQGLIARSSLMPIWDWLAGDIMPALHRDQCEKLTRAILAGDREDIQTVATELQSAGAAAITRALEGTYEGSARQEALAARLGGAEILADAVDMANVLHMAPVVNKVRKVMHKPVPRVTNDLAQFLKKAVAAVPEAAQDCLPYLFVVAMRRLERPWEILRVRAAVAKRGEDLGSVGGNFSIVVDILFGDLERRAQELANLNPQTFDPDDVMAILGGMGRVLRGLSDEMESVNDVALNARLEAVRETVAETLQMIFERLPKQIRDALPFQAAGAYAARSSKRPDLARKPVDAKMERAKKLGIFMRDSRPVAGVAGVGNNHADAYDQVLDGLNTYREGLLSEMRNIESADSIHNARAYLDLSVELTAILVSEGEAHILRRKAAEAKRTEAASGF